MCLVGTEMIIGLFFRFALTFFFSVAINQNNDIQKTTWKIPKIENKIKNRKSNIFTIINI